jgi:hypothetical protein
MCSTSKTWDDKREFNNLVFLTKNGNPVGNSTGTTFLITIIKVKWRKIGVKLK